MIHRVLMTVTLVVCLAVAIGAPRGLLLAIIAAAAGLTRHAYARQPPSGRNGD